MAQRDGTIIIDTRINTNGFNAGAVNMQSQFSKLAGAAKKLGFALGGVFAVGKIVQFGKEAIQLGSDLQEVQNVVDVTFGSLNGRINEFAKNAITQFGLSELSAKQYASTIGAMLKSMGLATDQAAAMSMEITGLAGDMASFYNLSGDEAFYKIRAGISGETEPLKQLGINLSVANLEQYALSQGITKTYNAMTEQEKALLRYNYLLSVTSDAQGDFARTSNSWANQTKVLSMQFASLKATIGQGLINVLTPVIKVINTILSGLQAVANAFRQFTALLFGSAGGTAQQVEDVASGFGSAAGAAEDLAGATEKAGKAAKKYLAGFDEITKISEKSGSAGGAGGGGTGGIGGVDFGGISLGGGEPVEDNISPQIQAIVDKCLALIAPLREIDFTPLKTSLKNLGGAFGELGALIVDGLEWAWFNILVPLAGWVIEDALPASVDLFSAAIGLLVEVLEVFQPFGIWLWENFLQPVAEWTGGVIVETLTLLSDALTAISEWIAENKTLVEDFIIVIGSFAAAWGLVTLALNAWNIGVALWNSLGAIATAVTTAFGAAVAFLTSPVTLVVAAIGALIAIVVLLIKHWDEVKAAAIKAWESIKQSVSTVVGQVKDALSTFVSVWAGAWDAVKKAASAAWDATKEAATEAWNGMKQVWGNVSSWFKTKVLDPLSKGFKGMVNSIIGFLNGMISGLCSGINFAIRAVNKLSVTIPSWVPGIGGNKFGFNLKTITAPQIPYLAKGAVIPPNAPFLAMLGDQKHGTNIEAPLSTIEEAVERVMRRNSGISDERIIVLLSQILEAILGIEIDGETLSRAIDNYRRKEAVSRG